MSAAKKRTPPPLSQCLSLAHWFAQQLGFADNAEMLKGTCDAGEENTLDYLLNSNRNPTIPPDILREMDANIAADLGKINRRRPVPVRLKYFQYLALLAAEYTLRRIAESPENLAAEINEAAGTDGRMPHVSADKLNKLAFWMATGAGKTLIMHLNMLQFRRYQGGIFVPDNVILITPNETMTAQHMEELDKSGIPARLFSDSGGMFGDSVVVLDIHKLSNKGSANGVTLLPETFVGRNLIFVDEGHKGSGGGDGGYFDKRDRLVDGGGFAFEYSATFGQAIAAAKDGERVKEYGRAILFDYSYGYFYRDKYGKEFSIRMAKKEDDENDVLMFANLLSFFEQLLSWRKYKTACAEFQIEKPLLLMLGATTVTADKDRTDIMKIAAFLRRAAADKDRQGDEWIEAAAQGIIDGESGISDAVGNDLFAGKFKFLRKTFGTDAAELCRELRELVFNADAPGSLQFRPMMRTGKAGGQSPEIALQVSGAENPFALIYVGNSKKLCDMAKQQEFEVLDEFVRAPLFPGVNKADSPVNVLVGAKKFMEGWSSWRVSGIGLLNVGMSEGPLIVQLFGRGVRLQGKNWSLKRSDGGGLDGDAKLAVQILETLNIFAVRADFMEKFREYISREGAICEEIPLPVDISESLAKEGKLHYPRPSAEGGNGAADFSRAGGVVLLRAATNIAVELDLTSRYVGADSAGGDGVQPAAAAHKTVKFNEKLRARIDFNDLYLRLQEHAASCGRYNFVVCFDELPNVLEKCKLQMDKSTGALLSGGKLQRIAFTALQQYADKVYGKARRQWEKNNMDIVHLEVGEEGGHPNFADYTLYLHGIEKKKVDKLEKELEGWLKDAKKQKMKNLQGAGGRMGNVYFERHLFQPLLFIQSDKSRLSPSGLNDGEKDFVECLRDTMDAGELPQGAKIFLLRNIPPDGVNIAIDGGYFYPDFLLWILSGGRERLVFVDPKGMLRIGKSEEQKMEAWKHLREISKVDKFRKQGFEVDSFLVSVTLYAETKWSGVKTKEELADEHVLFMEDLQDPEKRAETFQKMLGFYPTP